jgi:hypothetical protein
MSSATWSHHIASLATQLVAGDRNSTEISSLNFLRKNGKTFTYIGAKKNQQILLPCYQKNKRKGKKGKGCPFSASMLSILRRHVQPWRQGHSQNGNQPRWPGTFLESNASAVWAFFTGRPVRRITIDLVLRYPGSGRTKESVACTQLYGGRSTNN